MMAKDIDHGKDEVGGEIETEEREWRWGGN